jgi:hypothetical protein
MLILCTRCKLEKSPEKFSICRSSKNGLHSWCKECAKQARKEWSAKNADRQKASFAEYYRNHKESMDSASKAWVLQNTERRREIARKYAAANPERAKRNGEAWRKTNVTLMRQRYSQRRALKIQNMPGWANSDKIAEQYKLAEKLSVLTGIPHEVDHAVPLKSKLVCGLHCEANLQVLPRSQNRSKSNRHWPDMPN